jgi:hypothetical protein
MIKEERIRYSVPAMFFFERWADWYTNGQGERKNLKSDNISVAANAPTAVRARAAVRFGRVMWRTSFTEKCAGK